MVTQTKKTKITLFYVNFACWAFINFNASMYFNYDVDFIFFI